MTRHVSGNPINASTPNSPYRKTHENSFAKGYIGPVKDITSGTVHDDPVKDNATISAPECTLGPRTPKLTTNQSHLKNGFLSYAMGAPRKAPTSKHGTSPPSSSEENGDEYLKPRRLSFLD